MSALDPAPTGLASALRLVERVEPVGTALALRVLEETAQAIPFVTARQHPLGFMHVDLAGLTGRHGARLHVWTPRFQAGADSLGRLHDHVWELRSAVLAGYLIDHILKPEPAPDGKYRAHRVLYGTDANALEPLPGRWRLRESAARRRPSGQAYALAPGLVHSTEIVDLPTATLVLAVPVAGETRAPVVYVPEGSVIHQAGERLTVPHDIALEALASVERALRGQ